METCHHGDGLIEAYLAGVEVAVAVCGGAVHDCGGGGWIRSVKMSLGVREIVSRNTSVGLATEWKGERIEVERD
jgi:hypothetical protein